MCCTCDHQQIKPYSVDARDHAAYIEAELIREFLHEHALVVSDGYHVYDPEDQADRAHYAGSQQQALVVQYARDDRHDAYRNHEYDYNREYRTDDLGFFISIQCDQICYCASYLIKVEFQATEVWTSEHARQLTDLTKIDVDKRQERPNKHEHAQYRWDKVRDAAGHASGQFARPEPLMAWTAA